MENQSSQPEAQHPPSQGPRLDTIAEDVQHIIAAELFNVSPPSIRTMAHSSRTLRQVALPLVYKEVVLHREDDESKTPEAYEALVKLFRSGGKGSIAHHVRHLVVKDEPLTDDLMMILDRISEFSVLRKLSWETTAHMPPSVLDKLRKTWPDLELSVRVLGRSNAKKSNHRQMDEKLLSSSLLRDLTYDVYQGYEADPSANLEWAKLTRAISVGGSLRVLRLQMQTSGEKPESDLQLELFRNSHLPALKELTLHGVYNYYWTDEHLSMLASSVDMSILHTLNFARGMPTSLLKAFTGRLPGLKTLRGEIWRNANIEIATDFIKSVEGLEVLDIDGPASVIDALWPAIAQHRATLKNLCLRQPIEIGRLEDVVNSFPSVQRMGWNVAYDDRADYLGLMSRMNLERLELFMHLWSSANDYCGELISGRDGYYSPPLDKKRSQAAAVGMVQDLAAGSGHWLERLTLHLTRTEADQRGDPSKLWAKLQVRQDKRAGAEDDFEFRGKQKWEYREMVEEDLELEWPEVF